MEIDFLLNKQTLTKLLKYQAYQNNKIKFLQKFYLFIKFGKMIVYLSLNLQFPFNLYKLLADNLFIK